ncbi:hypothetical protein ITJ38_11945 [Agreia pratensis]|uniref:hypothetical protein n=1 Tax=Agreia pratensis TaxID=150121 RepID=UPI00188A35A7|nr:hypothetical protein [Agreia pratensis]MBF4635118.1 hypothetical protein [Agreia pratensis]
MTWRRRGSAFAAAVVASVVVSSGLFACSLLPGAPDSVSAAAATAKESLSGAPGVESVSAEVTLRDYRGEGSVSDPEAWVVRLTVNAAAGGRDLERAADEVVEALVEARPEAHIYAVIVAPRLAGDADAEILFDENVGAGGVAAERVTAARALAAVAGVSRVTVGRDDEPPRVEATGIDEWPTVAAGIRASPGFGVGAVQNPSLIAPLDSGDPLSGDGSDGLHLELGAVSPSASMIDEVTRLSEDRSVRSIWFSSGEGLLPAGGVAAERSSLAVDVDTSADAERVANRLAGLDDQRYWTQGSGRPSFQISSPIGNSADSSAIVGYVGLPLGSAEPDDLPAAPGVR